MVRRACLLPVSLTSACSSYPRGATPSSTHGMSGDCAAPGVTTSSWTTCSCRLKIRSRPLPRWQSNSPLAQLPIIPMMVAGIGAQFLGMARAAMAVTLEILRNKVSVDPGASIRERPSVLADIASYSAAVTAAASHLHASMETMWDKVRHQLPTAEDRGALYSAGLYAATSGAHAS